MFHLSGQAVVSKLGTDPAVPGGNATNCGSKIKSPSAKLSVCPEASMGHAFRSKLLELSEM